MQQLQAFLANLLAPPQAQNRLAALDPIMAMNRLEGKVDPMPVQPQTAPAAQPMAAPQQQGMQTPAQPVPQQRSGGGFLSGLFGNQGKNQTIQFLMQQGMDEGTAALMAGNKQALQSYLLDRAQGDQPDYGFMNIDGTLVRTDSKGNAVPLGQFGQQEDAARPMTPTERLKWGIPPEDKRPFAMTDDGPKLIGGSGVTINTGEQQTAGWKKIDEKFADTYVEWQSGAFADTSKQLAQLSDSLEILESGDPVTGAIGLVPDFAQPFINQQGTIAKDQVEEVVQRNLRLILGAQFTKEEGERLIARAYNSKLPPAENAKRVRRLIGQIGAMAEAKQAMVEYFDQNGTLRGYQGPRPSMADLDKIDFGDEAGVKQSSSEIPEFTDQKQIFEAIQNGQLQIGDIIILNGKKMRVDP